jgi:hypothetical protein
MTDKRKATKAGFVAEKAALLAFALMALPYGLSIFQSHFTQRDASAYLGMGMGMFWAGLGGLAIIFYIYFGTKRHNISLIDFVSAKELKAFKKVMQQHEDDAAPAVKEKVKENGTPPA